MAAKTQKIVLALGLVVLLALSAVAIWKYDIFAGRGSGLHQSFEYDLSQYREIPPEMMIGQELGPPLQLDFQPTALTVGPGDAIYIAGEGLVRILDSSGTIIGDIQFVGAPTSIAVDRNLDVYLGMVDHVEVYRNGARLAAWASLGARAILTSLALTDNDVFAADAGNRIVWRFDKPGKLLGEIGRRNPDRAIPGFSIPSPYFDLAIAPDGLLRVANPGLHRIEAYTFDSHLEFAWGTFGPHPEGFCGCCNPVNFAILPGGRFVTCEKGLTRVKLYDPQGAFLGVLAGPRAFAEHDKVNNETTADNNAGALDVAADSTGRVLVLDPLLRQVRFFVGSVNR